MPRILVVDDYEDIPKLAKITLEIDENFRVDVASSGEDALKLLKEGCTSDQTYDLMIVDCAMPVMDGLTFAKRVRELEKQLSWKHACIIMFTAHTEIARISSSILKDLNIAKVYCKTDMDSMFDAIREHFKGNGSKWRACA
jgi:CheY-like chemotaxis protein